MNIRFLPREALLSATLFTLTACGNSPSSNSGSTAADAQPAAAPTSEAGTVSASAVSNDLLADAKPGGHCSLDIMDGVTAVEGTPAEVKSSAPFSAGGWVVGSSLQAPPTFTLVFKGDSAYGIGGNSNLSRPDVGKSLGSDNANQSGFNINGDISKIPAGTYKVFAVLKDGSDTQICDFFRQVKIGG